MWGGSSTTGRRRDRRLVILGLVLSAVVFASPAAPSRAVDRASNEVALRDADPIVQPLAASDCPVDYVCLWQHQDFNGARVQYLSCCAWYNLADAGFNNMMSSWRNRKSVDAKVAENADGNGERLCLNDGSQNASVGAAWDNRASSIKIFSGSGAC